MFCLSQRKCFASKPLHKNTKTLDRDHGRIDAIDRQCLRSTLRPLWPPRRWVNILGKCYPCNGFYTRSTRRKMDLRRRRPLQKAPTRATSKFCPSKIHGTPLQCNRFIRIRLDMVPECRSNLLSVPRSVMIPIESIQWFTHRFACFSLHQNHIQILSVCSSELLTNIRISHSPQRKRTNSLWVYGADHSLLLLFTSIFLSAGFLWVWCANGRASKVNIIRSDLYCVSFVAASFALSC